MPEPPSAGVNEPNPLTRILFKNTRAPADGRLQIELNLRSKHQTSLHAEQ